MRWTYEIYRTLSEEPAKVLTLGSASYMCYPAPGIDDDADERWAVKKVQTVSDSITTIQWAGGTRDKIHAITDVGSLTYSNLT